MRVPFWCFQNSRRGRGGRHSYLATPRIHLVQVSVSEGPPVHLHVERYVARETGRGDDVCHAESFQLDRPRLERGVLHDAVRNRRLRRCSGWIRILPRGRNEFIRNDWLGDSAYPVTYRTFQTDSLVPTRRMNYNKRWPFGLTVQPDSS